MNKELGILLAVSSLPGNHGIGDFGECAYTFINWLKKNHFLYWQVLPINPIGPGNSPYMSTCSNAIEFRYISLDFLVKEGLLDSVPSFHRADKAVDYYAVGEFKKKYIWEAYKKFMKLYPETLHKYKFKNPWVNEYATFQVFKWKNENKQWNEWNEEDRDYYLTHNKPPKSLMDQINYVIFMQYEALKQWKHLHAYAKRKGIKIICDMPFYVGFDGVECWMHRDQFQINPETNKLFEVGGVGPDAFSEDGQLWGSPIYNFEKMKENNYSLLIDRIGYLLKLCDFLRIDHFRAFDTYYVIQADEETAKNGVWKLGPREEFFDAFYKKYPDANIIAEDLGDLRPEVLDLRDEYNLPGMFVIQFMICDSNNQSTTKHIVYSGTHDNETLLSWYRKIDEKQKESLAKRLGITDKRQVYNALMKYIFNMPSKITILPLQDILKLDNTARMNCPGTVGSPNWEWKLPNFGWTKKVIYPKKKWFKE